MKQQELGVIIIKSLNGNFNGNKLENIVGSGVTKIIICWSLPDAWIREFLALKGNTNIVEYCDFKKFNKKAFLEDVDSSVTLNFDQ